MDSKRMDWLDAARGLGIILVVIGHTKFRYIDFIYTFHMPLFFLISGYLCNSQNSDIPLREYGVRRFKRIMLPYFSACVGFYVFWVILGRHFGENAVLNVPVFKPLLGIFYANAPDNWLIFNTPLWFLPCLFLAELIFFIICKMSNNHLEISACLIFLAAAAGQMMHKTFYWPWSLDTALTAQVFLFLGYYLKQKAVLSRLPVRKVILLSIFLAIVLGTVYHLNGRIDMSGRHYNHIVLFYLGGIAGALLVFALAILIVRVKALAAVFTHCGKETLVILIFHNLAFKLVSVAAVVFAYSSLTLAQQELWSLYAVTGLIVPIGLGWIARKVTKCGSKVAGQRSLDNGGNTGAGNFSHNTFI